MATGARSSSRRPQRAMGEGAGRKGPPPGPPASTPPHPPPLLLGFVGRPASGFWQEQCEGRRLGAGGPRLGFSPPPTLFISAMTKGPCHRWLLPPEGTAGSPRGGGGQLGDSPEGRWGWRRALSPPRAVTGALGASSAGGGDGIQLAAAAAWGPLTGRASAPGLRAGGGEKGKGDEQRSISVPGSGRQERCPLPWGRVAPGLSRQRGPRASCAPARVHHEPVSLSPPVTAQPPARDGAHRGCRRLREPRQSRGGIRQLWWHRAAERPPGRRERRGPRALCAPSPTLRHHAAGCHLPAAPRRHPTEGAKPPLRHPLGVLAPSRPSPSKLSQNQEGVSARPRHPRDRSPPAAPRVQRCPNTPRRTIPQRTRTKSRQAFLTGASN